MYDVLVSARLVHFATIFAVFGCSLFWFYIGPDATPASPLHLAATMRRTDRLLRIVPPFVALSGVMWLCGTIANVTGGWSSLFDPDMLHVFFFETPFGSPAIVRLTLLSALLVIAALPLRSKPRVVTNLAIGTALLVSQAWLGHAVEGGASPYGAIMILAYAAHVLAAAAWIGGLPALAFAIEERRGGNHDTVAVHDILSRYSAMATVAVSVILISGIANTAFHVDANLALLASSGYGDVLFTKLLFVAIILLLASFNRFVIMPRLESHPMKGWRTIDHLRASLAFEMIVALLVLGAADILAITPPPQ